MTPTEPEVLAVRQLASEPSSESITRTWYRMTQLESKKHTVSRRRFLIPVAAAAVIGALTVGSVVFISSDGPRGGDYQFGASLETLAALESLALAAEGTTLTTLGPGQKTHSETDGWAATFNLSNDPDTGVMEPQPREVTFDPNGMIALSVKADGEDVGGGEPTPPQPASLRFPTPAWLAALPAEPVALLAFLRVQTGTHEKWTVDHQLWDAMAHLYSACEIILTPQTRAALLRSFGGMSNLTSREITLDGRALIAVRHTEGDSADEILFDPATGKAVGRSSLWLGSGVTLIQPPAGPVTEPNVLYVGTWVQSIVS
jgi:hypothetical protein